MKKLVVLLLLFTFMLIGCGDKEEVVPTVAPTPTSGLQQDVVVTQPHKSEYQASLGLEGDKNKDGRVDVGEPTKAPIVTEVPIQTEPTYDTDIKIWGWTKVPNRNQDGSSCKNYQSKVTLFDFGTYWGDYLTDEDFKGNERYLVGVEQNPDDRVKGDCESVGWLIQNLADLQPNDAIKFTNLHVIGSLSDTHVALLCSYDWYSAFGLDDTLVVFEDISSTLEVSDFKDGDIFSATVFAHNVKILEDVKGQRVVVVQYNIFK